jgi:lipid II:glycine glycyltransferase (peptidoglycan interpeptide bridge formation enzyme)
VRSAFGHCDAGVSLSFVGHRLSLEKSPAEIFDGCESSVRRAIRKAEKSGLIASVHTDLESLAAYYRLHCRVRKRHGVPPQPFSFFQAIADHVLSCGRGFVVLATKGGELVAGAVFFHFNRHAIYKFSASDESFQECRGPNLVIWTALQYLQQLGCANLTFGRTSSMNQGLRRFKAGFGAEEYAIRYAHYSFKRQSFIRQVDLAEGSARRLFRLLPLPLSRLIGAAAYRHMA